jgi:RNA recognition motif-containing protein
MYDSSKNRGLAFVTMGSEEEALAALNNLNSTVSLSTLLRVCSLWLLTVDVSSDIEDEDREKCGDTRSISQMNTVGFRLVQTLFKSNNPVFSFAVLYYEI